MENELIRTASRQEGARLDGWLWPACIGHAVEVPKTSKVVPIVEHKDSLIAHDSQGQRIIMGIGSERIAIDFFRRITKLPPHIGDQPATVLPMSGQDRRTKQRA
jgi:hypothetical protein